MLKFIKVTGNSLSPFFLPGDFVIIGLKPVFSRSIQPGDYIVFNHPEHGRLIKKVTDFDPINDHIIVSGTHSKSLGSIELGPISSRSVLGKVLLHIKNPLSHSTD